MKVIEVLSSDEEGITVRIRKDSAMIEFAAFIAPFGDHVEAFRRGEFDLEELKARCAAADHWIDRQSKDIRTVELTIDVEAGVSLWIGTVTRKGGSELLHHHFYTKED